MVQRPIRSDIKWSDFFNGQVTDDLAMRQGDNNERLQLFAD